MHLKIGNPCSYLSLLAFSDRNGYERDTKGQYVNNNSNTASDADFGVSRIHRTEGGAVKKRTDGIGAVIRSAA